MLGSGCPGPPHTGGGNSKVRISSAKMCAAHGGTFNSANKTCTYAPTTRSAQQVCRANGGYYDTESDVCEFNP